MKAVFGSVEWNSNDWDTRMNHLLNHHAPLLLLQSRFFFDKLVFGLSNLFLKVIVDSSLMATAAPTSYKEDAAQTNKYARYDDCNRNLSLNVFVCNTTVRVILVVNSLMRCVSFC